MPLPLKLFTRRFSAILARKLDQKYLLKALPLDKPSFVSYLSGYLMLFKYECLIDLGAVVDKIKFLSNLIVF